MKNVYLYIVFLLIGFNSFGQGVDVIFWVDNSNSITDSEYQKMSTSIKNTITQVLECNGSNKVAVVHYGATNGFGGGTAASYIFIESDFTNNLTTATSFVRRTTSVGGGDWAHEALFLIGNALDNVTSSYIASPQKKLTRTATNSLVIVLFSDALRNTGDTYLVNHASSAYGTDVAFQNYTSFKINRNAKFLVVHPNGNSLATEAAAAIASSGFSGSYIGSVESYPSDPDASTLYARYLYLALSLNDSQVLDLSSDICGQAEPCKSNLVLTSAVNDVLAGIQDKRQAESTITASNIVNNGGVGIYHAGYDVVLKHGFSSANGSVFRAYIEDCSNEYEGLRVADEQETMRVASTDEESEKELFTLYPNPAIESVIITSDKLMQNITLTSLDGFTLFQGDVRANSYDLNVSNYRKGIYVITVTTDDGEMEMKKLIKE